MTVAELIEVLRTMPQDAPVLSEEGEYYDAYEVTVSLGWAVKRAGSDDWDKPDARPSNDCTAWSQAVWLRP